MAKHEYVLRYNDYFSKWCQDLVGCCLEFAEPVMVYKHVRLYFLVIFFLKIVSMTVMILVKQYYYLREADLGLPIETASALSEIYQAFLH